MLIQTKITKNCLNIIVSFIDVHNYGVSLYRLFDSNNVYLNNMIYYNLLPCTANKCLHNVVYVLLHVAPVLLACTRVTQMDLKLDMSCMKMF